MSDLRVHFLVRVLCLLTRIPPWRDEAGCNDAWVDINYCLDNEAVS